MKTVKSGCCATKAQAPKNRDAANGSLSFLSTLLLILVPKCPLCMTAYMSAMVMFFDIEYTTLVPVLLHTKPLMGLIIIAMILLNRKDKRTWVALCISGVTWICLVLKTYFGIALGVPDGAIYGSFLFAIWYNGNFRYFYRFLRVRFDRIIKTSQAT